jgi:hypothetical protein
MSLWHGILFSQFETYVNVDEEIVDLLAEAKFLEEEEENLRLKAELLKLEEEAVFQPPHDDDTTGQDDAVASKENLSEVIHCFVLSRVGCMFAHVNFLKTVIWRPWQRGRPLLPTAGRGRIYQRE